MSITNNSLGRLTFGPSPIEVDGLVLFIDAASRRSYTGGGTTWKDLSGNNNDLTIYGDTTFNERYFTLNGSISQYVQINPFQHPTDDFTIELFERINTFNNTPLYSYAVTGDSNEGLLYSPAGLIYIYGPTGGQSTGYTINTGQWYHIVRTRAYASGTEKLYINGELITTITLAAGTKTEAGGSFNIGQEQDSPGGGFDGTQTLNGDVMGARIYNRVLPQSQVIKNYDNIKSRFTGA